MEEFRKAWQRYYNLAVYDLRDFMEISQVECILEEAFKSGWRVPEYGSRREGSNLGGLEEVQEDSGVSTASGVLESYSGSF